MFRKSLRRVTLCTGFISLSAPLCTSRMITVVHIPHEHRCAHPACSSSHTGQGALFAEGRTVVHSSQTGRRSTLFADGRTGTHSAQTVYMRDTHSAQTVYIRGYTLRRRCTKRRELSAQTVYKGERALCADGNTLYTPRGIPRYTPPLYTPRGIPCYTHPGYTVVHTQHASLPYPPWVHPACFLPTNRVNPGLGGSREPLFSLLFPG